jgi:hypothetical protein
VQIEISCFVVILWSALWNEAEQIWILSPEMLMANAV